MYLNVHILHRYKCWLQPFRGILDKLDRKEIKVLWHANKHSSAQMRISMKILLLSEISIITLLSCNNKLYGTYNTNHSKDKSSFYQLKLNADNTVEKTEIHTIRDFAKGRFLITIDKHVICFLDSSSSIFPPDTLTFKSKGKKLYFVRNKSLNKVAYLAKQ